MPQWDEPDPDDIGQVIYLFSTALHPPRRPGRAKAPNVEWRGPGESLEVGQYVIRDPLTYVAVGKSKADDPACVDPRLKVGTPSTQGFPINYWSGYPGLSPDQRATYLEWLAGGRATPPPAWGYESIFLYGLERRLLVDGKDRDVVFAEAARLAAQHRERSTSDPYGYDSYYENPFGRFLRAMLVVGGLDKASEADFERAFASRSAIYGEESVSIALAWFYLHKRPLPARWAMAATRLDQRTRYSVIPERVPEEFGALFALRYAERCGAGILLRASKRPRWISYRPSNYAILSSVRLPALTVPNVLAITRQFAPLVAIWAECVEALRPYSRLVGRGEPSDSAAAYEALPSALRAGRRHPEAPAWERAHAEAADADGVAVVTAGSLAALRGVPQRPRLTPTQSTALARAAQLIGFAVEPDARVLERPYEWDEPLALWRPDAKWSAEPDAGRYRGAATLLELGAALAGQAELDAEVLGRLADFAAERFKLPPLEVARLRVWATLLPRRAPSLPVVGKRLRAALAEADRAAFALLLAHAMAAAVQITPWEVAALEVAYRALGVNREALKAALADLGVAADVVEVRRAVPGRGGERLPPRRPQPVEIDEARVRHLLEESRAVSALLGEAMRDGEQEAAVAAAAPVASAATTPAAELGRASHTEPMPRTDVGALPAEPNGVIDPSAAQAPADGRFEGLDPRYQGLLAALLARDAWDADAYEALVRAHRLMPASALATINEWAEEQLGDLLLEEGDPITVNQDLLERVP